MNKTVPQRTGERSAPIVQVIDDLEVGGAQTLLIAFTTEARRRGDSVVVIAVGSAANDGIRTRLLDAGAEIRTITAPVRGQAGRALHVARLAAELRRLRPDVVHTHLTYANVIGGLAAQLAGIATAATIHNSRTGDDGNPDRMLKLETALLKRNTDRVYAVGPQAAAAAAQRLDAAAIRSIPNAVPVPEALQHEERARVRSRLGWDDSHCVVIAVGRLVEQKGFADLITAFAAASREVAQLRLVIAGEGEYRERLEAQIAGSGLAHRVSLIGARHDVSELIAAADLVVQPSWWEGLPMTVLEAMAAGKALIATSVGDIPTVVTDQTGVLVPPRSPDLLAASMVALARDPVRRDVLGQAARALVQERFGLDRWYDALLSFYAGRPDREPRVVMLIQRYWPWIGGAERQLGDVAPALNRAGVKVQIITRQLPGTSRHEVIDGVPVHRVPVPGPKPVASVLYTLQTLLLIRRLRPDIVHAHELLSPATTALAAARLFRVRTSTTAHRSGELGDVQVLTASGGGAQRLKLLAQQIDRFITISSEIADELAGIGVDRSRQRLIPNGVDTERFRPPTNGEQDELRSRLGLPDGPIALFTGRLAPEKRVRMLVELWPQVRESVPDAQFVIVGSGEEEAAIRRVAGPGITLAGSQDDVAPFHRAADVFVLPSIAEGLSVAMLEAMASGKPPVMSSVGGTADVIEHGRTGWLVDPASPAELVSGLSLLLGDARRRHELGVAARTRVVESFSLQETVRLHEELYDELSRRSRPRWWGSR